MKTLLSTNCVADDTKITDDGGEFTKLNGVCDWANEEENIKADNTIYWNKNGDTILYASYDLSRVQMLQYNTYGGSYRNSLKSCL